MSRVSLQKLVVSPASQWARKRAWVRARQRLLYHCFRVRSNYIPKRTHFRHREGRICFFDYSPRAPPSSLQVRRLAVGPRPASVWQFRPQQSHHSPSNKQTRHQGQHTRSLQPKRRPRSSRREEVSRLGTRLHCCLRSMVCHRAHHCTGTMCHPRRTGPSSRATRSLQLRTPLPMQYLCQNPHEQRPQRPVSPQSPKRMLQYSRTL